jgi:UDP-glucose 4-epimerase
MFAPARPETVFHLAARIDVRFSVEDPSGGAASNGTGAINVLQAGTNDRREAHGQLLHRRAVYGAPEVLPTPEVHPIRSRGRPKSTCEGLRAILTGL